MSQPDRQTKPTYDRTYLHSLRETYVILGLFALFCVWSIVVSYNLGYVSESELGNEIRTVWGMPSWVWWGIFLPWIAVDVVAIWFCFFFMKADDLGEESEQEAGDV